MGAPPIPKVNLVKGVARLRAGEDDLKVKTRSVPKAQHIVNVPVPVNDVGEESEYFLFEHCLEKLLPLENPKVSQ